VRISQEFAGICRVVFRYSHDVCSKKGMSAHQFFRMTETFYGKKVSYRSAWFMFHRIRFAMTQHPMIDKLRGIVEVDETWVGPKEKGIGGGLGNRLSKKRPVMALVDRERGKVRSFPKEYSRRENGRHITTNTVEGYFVLLKRGLYGTYHHVGMPYLQQYLNEFDFRYNARKVSDAERSQLAMKATEGKRLTLRKPVGVN
jgi:hypothetical protein